MFCPRCATQNELEQGYCRQCGQSLSSLRLALEGNADKSLEKLKAGEEWLKGGSVILVVFTLIALAIGIVGVAVHELSFGYIAFINLLLGTTIGTPLVCFGRSKVKRAVGLLSKSQNEASQTAFDEAHRRYNLPASGFNTQSPLPTAQSSVTENTTLALRRPEHVHRRPS